MKYFFIHIPKTSGTTFMDVLQKDKNNQVGFFYPERPDMDDFEKRIKEGPAYNQQKTPDWNRFNIIGGHFTYGIHQTLGVQDFKYIGVVREPVSHFVSCFRAFHRLSDTYKNFLLPGTKAIEDFLQLEHLHNMQTFFLSGLSIQQIKNDKNKAYNTAVENYEKHFAGIYPTHQFDEGLFYFKHKAGIKPLHYYKKNVATNFAGQVISPGTIERIKEVNDVDIQLYEYFNQRFNTEFNQLPMAALQVKWFKLINRLYSIGR